MARRDLEHATFDALERLRVAGHSAFRAPDRRPRCQSSIAADLDGAPGFLATSAFNLRYDQERWPKIGFADVKDYQKRV